MIKESHEHMHGIVDTSLLATDRGIWAIKWSFIALFVTACLQAIIVYYSGSISLLVDAIHNFGDALAALPLWVAFLFAKKKPSKRFTYGYGRVEDFAGLCVVLAILMSAILAGYKAISRFFYPQEIKHLENVLAASLIGFLGNEAVALFLLNVGKEINSAALIVNGYHARIDGLVSLGVLVSVIGIWYGYPIVDSLVGFLMMGMIVKIVWESSIAIFTRLLDGVDSELVDKMHEVGSHVKGVIEMDEIRVRWLGHRLHAEARIHVSPMLSVEEGNLIARQVQSHLRRIFPFLERTILQVMPLQHQPFLEGKKGNDEKEKQ